MTERVRSGLRIPMELNTELILRAQADGISKNALMLQILKTWVEEKKKAANQDRAVRKEGEKEQSASRQN